MLHRLFQRKTSGTALEPVHNRMFPKETTIVSSSVCVKSLWLQLFSRSISSY
jgi:hypothetical protein